MEVELHVLLILERNGSEWSALRSSRFTPDKKEPLV
jgi:hypothetical protein